MLISMFKPFIHKVFIVIVGLLSIMLVLYYFLFYYTCSFFNFFRFFASSVFVVVVVVFNLLFNWRITALQYCVGFCHISTWSSHSYTYVPSLLNLPPIPSHSIPSLFVVTKQPVEVPSSIQQIPTGYLFYTW